MIPFKSLASLHRAVVLSGSLRVAAAPRGRFGSLLFEPGFSSAAFSGSSLAPFKNSGIKTEDVHKVDLDVWMELNARSELDSVCKLNEYCQELAIEPVVFERDIRGPAHQPQVYGNVYLGQYAGKGHGPDTKLTKRRSVGRTHSPTRSLLG